MAQAQTNSAELRMGFEATFGTTATSMKKYPYTTFDISQNQNQNDSNVIRGGRDESQPFNGFKSATASVTIPLMSIAIGDWLKALFGTVSAPFDNLDGTYTHTFTASQITPSISLEKAYTDITRFHLGNGYKVSDMAVSYGGEDEPVLTFNLAGKKVTPSGAEAVAPTTVLEGVKFEPFEAGITGATNVRTAELNINNNLETDNYIIGSDGEVGSLPNGRITANGSFEAYYEDDTFIDDATNSTERALTLTFTKGLSTLSFIMEEILLETPTVSSAGEGLIQNAGYKAFYGDGASGVSIKAVLTNTQATQI